MQQDSFTLAKIVKEIQDKHYFIFTIDQLGQHLISSLSKCYKSFSNSWNNLCIDNYMSDGGKYRYRRYNVIQYYTFRNYLEILPNEPHFQKETYNLLNGGIYRHYEPFEEKTLKNPILKFLIENCANIFNLATTQYDWRVECHQFRIKPTLEFSGLPTPEGKHRDGVDYVFMMLVNRVNILGGVTGIYNNIGNFLTLYTLKQPFECILLDDTKIMHKVSPVYKKDMDNFAYRDMLVLTFQKIIT